MWRYPSALRVLQITVILSIFQSYKWIGIRYSMLSRYRLPLPNLVHVLHYAVVDIRPTADKETSTPTYRDPRRHMDRLRTEQIRTGLEYKTLLPFQTRCCLCIRANNELSNRRNQTVIQMLYRTRTRILKLSWSLTTPFIPSQDQPTVPSNDILW